MVVVVVVVVVVVGFAAGTKSQSAGMCKIPTRDVTI